MQIIQLQIVQHKDGSMPAPKTAASGLQAILQEKGGMAPKLPEDVNYQRVAPGGADGASGLVISTNSGSILLKSHQTLNAHQ
jgi:hypothetical protein